MNSNNLLSGFTILLALQFICTWLVGIAQLAFPAPLLGMIVLAILLIFNIIKVEQIEAICTLLMDKLSLFFVPGVVSSIVYMDLVKKEALPLFLAVCLSTAIIIVGTGLFLQFLLKIKEAKKHA